MVSFRDLKYKLERPSVNSDKAVILLPGIHGHALDDYRYDSLGNYLTANGFYFLRIEFWNSNEERGEYRFSDFHKILDEACSFLKSFGCPKIGIVAKSFGGGIALSYKNPELKGIVVWAPAIGFSENSTFEKDKDMRLFNFNGVFDIKLNPNDLRKVTAPTLFIQGDEDKNVPMKNTELLQTNVLGSKLEIVEGANHQYDDPRMLRKVVDKTIEFLKRKVR